MWQVRSSVLSSNQITRPLLRLGKPLVPKLAVFTCETGFIDDIPDQPCTWNKNISARTIATEPDKAPTRLHSARVHLARAADCQSKTHVMLILGAECLKHLSEAHNHTTEVCSTRVLIFSRLNIKTQYSLPRFHPKLAALYCLDCRKRSVPPSYLRMASQSVSGAI